MIGDSQLAQFSGRYFLTLETYRRDGSAVRTPLFFIKRAGVLYMRTGRHTYKIERIQGNSQVRVVPSTWWGRPLGVWVKGRAQLYDAVEMAWVNEVARQKYGPLKWFIDLRSRLKGTKFVVIAVTPTN